MSRLRSTAVRLVRILVVLGVLALVVAGGLLTRGLRARKTARPVLLPAEDITLSAPEEPADPATVQPPAPVASPPVAAADSDAATRLEFAEVERFVGAPPPTPARAEAYSAERSRSVVELQQWREAHSFEVPGPAPTIATLVDLNPWVHEWFLVQLTRPDGSARTYHLENPDPETVRVSLDPAYTDGVSLVVDGQTTRCPLWSKDDPALETARTSGQIFAPLCSGRLALRNPAEGRRSTKEWTTDFLRDNVWGGEQITTFVRDTVYKDSELVTSDVVDATEDHERPTGAPQPARVDATVAGRRIGTVALGLPSAGLADGTITVGTWSEVDDSIGVYVSAIQPRFVDPQVTASWGDRIEPLDEVESTALVYVVAFDLAAFELAFDRGTDHPRVEWSSRTRLDVRPPGLDGPDGFDNLSPLVHTGKFDPTRIRRLTATFTGGFKRSHGAFKSGDLSQVNYGSHYGWVEHGVVESRPWPGLVTVVAWLDGTVDIKVWSAADDADLWKVRALRQNGVPVLERAGDGTVMPGNLVRKWSDGNWSGSVDGRLRSVRASLCIQESEAGRFLLYAYHSSATPSAMATTLAAYECGTAMLTDMNALEHTYLALHHVHDGTYSVNHLVEGMEVLDKVGRGGVYLPRFVGMADNRDFFTLVRR